MIVIEMNPRVSRSSALASKATGFPIAKIAAKLAVGYRLDEIPNDITSKTPAAFEPTLDYVVVKVPRFAFEKFPRADPVLTTHMKCVGEVMAIGRTFTEALGKALRSLETKAAGFWTTANRTTSTRSRSSRLAAVPTDGRLYRVERAIRAGATVDEVVAITGIDPWFVDQIAMIVRDRRCGARRADAVGSAAAQGETARSVGSRRLPRCAQSWRARTACARYGTARRPAGLQDRRHVRGRVRRRAPRTTTRPTTRRRSRTAARPREGDHPRQRAEPDRAGHRVRLLLRARGLALRDAGYETVMVNCNPETVSTDYDTADRLYFEPLTFEDVLAVVPPSRSPERRPA